MCPPRTRSAPDHARRAARGRAPGRRSPGQDTAAGLMHHHHANRRGLALSQQTCHTVDLRGHLPVLARRQVRAAFDPDDQQVRRRVNRLEVGAEHLGEARVPAGQARPEIEQGDVVVAGHRQDRGAPSRFTKALAARTGGRARAA